MAFTSEEVELFLQVARDATLGATYRERLEGVTEALLVLVPGTSMSALVVDEGFETEPPQSHVYLRNVSVQSGLDYATHHIKADPMNVVYQEASGTPALLSDYVLGRRFGSDAFTGDFLSPLRIRHIIGCVHRMPQRARLGLAIHREGILGDFTRKERETLRLISPDIARAAFGALLQEKVTSLAAAVPDDLAGVSSGAIVFNALGDVVHADRGALALTKQLLVGERFPADSFVLEVRKLSAQPSLAGRTAERAFQLKSRGWVLARFSAVGDRDAAVICVLEVLAPGSPDYFQAVADDARLTPREREVAALAIRGLGNRHIALKLSMSSITVATHLTRIYAKTRVTGRTELATLLLGGTISKT